MLSGDLLCYCHAMKNIYALLVILIFVSLSSGHALDSQSISRVSDGVVLLSQRVYIDGKKSTEPRLWEKVERHIGEPVLDSFVAVSTGTGFFIDGEGRLLTNQHVVAKRNESQLIKEIISSIQSAISYDIPDSVLTSEERFKLRLDTSRVLKDAKLVLHVSSSERSFQDAEVISADEKLDLALVRTVQKRDSKPLLLGSENSPAPVGEKVTAFGFPLPTLFKSIYKADRVTVTQGNVSAIRSDVSMIQHTAALNPGNSGGPLVDENGTVIGVNVGEVRNANSFFFAIDMRRVADFLVESGNGQVLAANRASSNALAAQGPVPTIRSVGKTFIVSSEKGAVVSLDGKPLGIVPCVVDMTKATAVLSVTGDKGEATLSLSLDPAITRTIGLEVALVPYSGILSVRTLPQGASVSVDGSYRGTSPVEIRLPIGDHLVHAASEGLLFDDGVASVAMDKTTALEMRGLALLSIPFICAPPPGTHFSLSDGRRSLEFLDPPELKIPAGTWAVVVENEDFFAKTEFTLSTESARPVDPSAWLGTGSFTVTNIMDVSRVFVDGAEVVERGSSVTLTLKCGPHVLKISNPRFLDFSQEIKVVRNKPGMMIAAQEYSKEAARKRNLVFFGGLTAACLAVSVPSLIYGLSMYDSSALSAEPNTFMYIGGYGCMAASITGICFILNLP